MSSQAVGTIPVIIYRSNEIGEIIDINDYASHKLGLSKGDNISKLYVLGNRDVHIRRIMSSEIGVWNEYDSILLRKLDTNQIVRYDYCSFVENKDPLTFQCILKEAIGFSKYEVFNSLPNAVIEFNDDWEILSWNNEFEILVKRFEDPELGQVKIYQYSSLRDVLCKLDSNFSYDKELTTTKDFSRTVSLEFGHFIDGRRNCELFNFDIIKQNFSRDSNVFIGSIYNKNEFNIGDIINQKIPCSVWRCNGDNCTYLSSNSLFDDIFSNILFESYRSSLTLASVFKGETIDVERTLQDLFSRGFVQFEHYDDLSNQTFHILLYRIHGNKEEKVLCLALDTNTGLQNLFLTQTRDVSNFFHTFTGEVGRIKVTAHTIIEGHSTDAVKGDKVQYETVNSVLIKATKNLALAIEKLIEYIKFGWGGSINSFINERIEDLEYFKGNLLQLVVNSRIGKEGELRIQVLDIINVTENLKSHMNLKHGHLKEPFKLIKKNNEVILRYTKLLSLDSISNKCDNLIERGDRIKLLTLAMSNVQVSEKVFVNLLLEEIMESLSGFASVYRVKLTRRFRTSDTDTMFGARLEMYLIILNIIQNAIKYSILNSNRYNPVIVESSRDSNHVFILISNLSHEIEHHEVESQSLFAFGRRGNATRALENSRMEDIPGTGIGLWYCRNAIRKLGGEIEYSSEPARGQIIIPQSDFKGKQNITTFKLKFRNHG